MAPGEEQTGAGPGPTGSAGAQPAENSSPGDEGAPDGPAAEGTVSGDNTTGGRDLSLALQDIFTEAQEVDESIRDLADFVEGALAQDLVTEFREFLDELEARQT